MKLLAGEDLKQGRVVFSANPVLDIDIPASEFDRMDENAKEEIRQWGFLLEPEDVWHVDFDISRFLGHSPQPTLVQEPNHKDVYLVAARDIQAGEELTQNYLP